MLEYTGRLLWSPFAVRADQRGGGLNLGAGWWCGAVHDILSWRFVYVQRQLAHVQRQLTHMHCHGSLRLNKGSTGRKIIDSTQNGLFDRCAREHSVCSLFIHRGADEEAVALRNNLELTTVYSPPQCFSREKY